MNQGNPHISGHVLRWFMVYVRRMLRREFYGVRVLSAEGSTGVPPVSSAPADALETHGRDARAPFVHVSTVVYLNHSSWWDPLISMLLAERCFPGRPVYAPMEAAQLERYGIFKKLGVFGVEPGTARGAREFLKAGASILANPDAMLWLTPQARFSDVRERPLRFNSGLAKLAQRFPQAQFLPLALEYVFWNERRPEVLAHFGPPESGAALVDRLTSTAALTAHFENSLTAAQNTLSAAAVSREASRFQSLLHGGESVSGVYDLWRRIKAWRRGETFQAAHGAAPSFVRKC